MSNLPYVKTLMSNSPPSKRILKGFLSKKRKLHLFCCFCSDIFQVQLDKLRDLTPLTPRTRQSGGRLVVRASSRLLTNHIQPKFALRQEL